MPKFIAIIFALMLTTLSAHSQSFLKRSEIGFAVGGMNYIGDLNKQSMFGKPNMGYGAFYRYKIDERWAIFISGCWGKVSGGNPDAIAIRNLSFQSPIREGSARVEFNFRPFGVKGKSYTISTFLFCGLGLFTFNPQAHYFNPTTDEYEWVDLRPLGTEGQGTDLYPDRIPYTLNQLMMPFGFGVKAKLGKALFVTLEYGFRKTWTDYLDDVSTTYVESSILSPLAAELADRSNEIQEGYVNAPGIQRGDDSLKDWYAYFNISLSFNMDFLFGWMKSKKCKL